MALFQRYNNENVLTRAIIAGLLDVLNNHIKYNQIWGNDSIEEFETISVPWFYSQSGDERFMQDFYTHYAECLPPRPVDGNFDMIPRGIITYTGSDINAQRITSRYVQGRYVKEVDGKLEGFVSYLYSIPINIRFDCELWADTQLTALKIEQEIREVLYKTVTFYVYYKGMRVGCTAGFPETIGIEKKIEYAFESENKIKLTFQLEVESYQPVFDPTTEMHARNNIKKFTYRLYDKDEKSDGDIHDAEAKQLINGKIISPSSGATLPKGNPMWIEWKFTREGGIMRNVDLYWLNTGSNEINEISLVEPNHEYYIWNIPDDFTSYKEPDIIWEESSGVSVSRKPILKIIPDLNTKQIDSSSFKAFSEGYFLTLMDEATINIQLEMKDDNGNISYTPDGAIYANIRYNKLDTTNPVTVTDPSIFFPGTLDYREIDIHIANSVNNDVFGIIANLTII
jgi:hypothetical protein